MQHELIDVVMGLAAVCQQLELVSVSVHQIHTHAYLALGCFLIH